MRMSCSLGSDDIDVDSLSSGPLSALSLRFTSSGDAEAVNVFVPLFSTEAAALFEARARRGRGWDGVAAAAASSACDRGGVVRLAIELLRFNLPDSCELT